MKEHRLIDARFLNSVMAGMADMLFKWDGGVFSIMGYNVGKELLDIIGKDLDLKGGSRDENLRELCRQLVETYQVADSVTVMENREKECIEFRAENCVLLPFAKREAKRNPFFNRVPLCPIKNLIIGVLEYAGENTEVRTFHMDGDQCHVVIGLIEELPMEKELKEMKIGD